MSDEELASTMRIDIHPDFKGESLSQRRNVATQRLDETTVVARSPVEEATSDYKRLLQSVYDGVFITDTKGRIIELNSRAVDFFLSEEEELVGTRVTSLISGADESLMETIHDNLLRGHRYTVIEAYCVRRDGSTFPTEVAVGEVELDERPRLCFFVRDITLRKKAQDDLEKAVVRLEAHDRARSQFVSNVSHELRTPLTSMIYGIANMLRGVAGSLPESVRDYLEVLNGDCKRLLGTVNDILDLRQIESRTLKLARTRVPIVRLIERSVRTLLVQAERKRQTVHLSEGDRKWFVDCDALKMERVILNVVGNAVKFTPDGGDIDVAVQADPERVGHVLISVVDSGIGIPAEVLDRVTVRYFTVGEQPSGCGLGLAISKEIVDLHEGEIWLESPPDGREQGTGVHISLPVVEPPTVLIVDDNRAILDLLERQIADQGYRVLRAQDGLEALDTVHDAEPDIVVLDMALPELDGAGVILKMRSERETMRIPIVVITGADVGRERAELLDGYSIPAMSKPWEESELLDRIAEAFLGQASLDA